MIAGALKRSVTF